MGCGDHSGDQSALHLLLQDGLSAGELPHSATGRHADVHALRQGGQALVPRLDLLCCGRVVH